MKQIKGEITVYFPSELLAEEYKQGEERFREWFREWCLEVIGAAKAGDSERNLFTILSRPGTVDRVERKDE